MPDLRRRGLIAMSTAGLGLAVSGAFAAALGGESSRRPGGGEPYPRERSDGRPWDEVFARMPAELSVLVDEPQHAVQLRWIRIVRDARGHRRYVVHDRGLAPKRWFPAASVAKLPMALLMAEALQARGGDASTLLRLDAPPASGEWSHDEPVEEPFLHGLRRTFAVSDNTPFNRWYELLGADAVHRRLVALGYPHVRLIARLGSSDPEANRRSGGGAMRSAQGEWRRFPAAVGRARRFPFGAVRVGDGWMGDDGVVIPGPHDFSRANFLPLADSLRMLQAFMWPESVPAAQRWRIEGGLRATVLHALAARPRDHGMPAYPEAQYPDGYARWFFVGDGRERYPQGLSVFGKSGMAYGSLSEVAYVIDRVSGAEFMLAASIQANADGIYNDNRYEYATVALPFMAAFGRAVLESERASAGRNER